MDYELQNVQAVDTEADGGEPSHHQLQDVDWVFLEAASMQQDDTEAASNTGRGSRGVREQADTAQQAEDDSIEELRAALLETR